jgi:nuclear RNA export factor
MPNQRKLEWSAWLGHGSRNLHRLAVDRVVEALHIGAQDIVQALVKLPLTKHDILGAPENFCVDAFLAGVGLLVIVHGQFIEGTFISFLYLAFNVFIPRCSPFPGHTLI